MKRYYLVLALTVLTGCGTLLRQSHAFNKEEFEKMMAGGFSTVDEVVSFLALDSANIDRRVDMGISHVRAGLEAILNLSAERRTFENTCRALDEIDRQFNLVFGPIQVCEMTHPDEQIRGAARAASLKLRAFSVDAFMNPKLYQAFKEYVDGAKQRESLSDEQEYYIDKMMRDFKRNGFHLPEQTFEQAKVVRKKIQEIGQAFKARLQQDDSHILVDQDQLAGISDKMLRALPHVEGKVKVGVDYPTYYEVIKHCSVGNTRKRLYKAFNNRGYPENIEHLEQIFALRDQLAQMLGFKSYAHLDTYDKMVKTPERAEEFLVDLAHRAQEKAAREMKLLKQHLPDGVTLTGEGQFEPWDLAYVQARYKKETFNLDDRIVAQYFPVGTTIDGIFSIYQKFLGVRFAITHPGGLWRDDIGCITVTDATTGRLRGYVVLDLYPRKGKYSHACCASVAHTQKLPDGSLLPGISVVIANFPQGTGDKPGLLKHSDVTTFFHEFGHAMHGVLGATEMVEFSGTGVKHDFVEMPSQMFEEWMWDRKMLARVSSHYQTGTPLPDGMIDTMLELKNLTSGYYVTRQAWLARIALACHRPGGSGDTSALVRQLHEHTNPFVRFDPDTHFQASFGHLYGYAAGYYGYLWSKVFALDLFDAVRKHGLLDEAIGQKFLAAILGRGGSVDPDVMLEEFLGRPPNQKAFLKDLGL